MVALPMSDTNSSERSYEVEDFLLPESPPGSPFGQDHGPEPYQFEAADAQAVGAEPEGTEAVEGQERMGDATQW